MNEIKIGLLLLAAIYLRGFSGQVAHLGFQEEV
jgi:hypothetical protein